MNRSSLVETEIILILIRWRTRRKGTHILEKSLKKTQFAIFFTSFIRCESSSGKDSKPVLFNFNHRKFGISATRFGKSSFWNEKSCALLRMKMQNWGKKISPSYLEVIPGQIKTTNERKHTFRHLESRYSSSLGTSDERSIEDWELTPLYIVVFVINNCFIQATAKELHSLLLKH